MDLKLFDFGKNIVVFEPQPSLIDGTEQLAQYFLKVLTQNHGSNLSAPGTGSGVFNNNNDFFITTNLALETTANYIIEQQEEFMDLSEDVLLSEVTDVNVDYKDGVKRINATLTTVSELETVASAEG